MACITLLSFSPLYAISIDSIHNENIQFAWENSYIKSNQNFLVTALIEGPDPEHVYVLENNDTGTSKLLNISTEDGQVVWEKSYSENYDRYKVWSNNTLVLLKTGNKGFTVLNLRTGKKVYDYKIDETVQLEFLNLEANDRTVLMTENTNQTLFDRDYGLISLDTLGNNFYELIEGNQCALIKNNLVYIYKNERLQKTKGIYNFDGAEYIYYDEGGMIVFNKDEIVQYSSNLQTINSNQYLKLNEHNIKLFNTYFKKINEEVTFYMFDGHRKYAYVFNSKEFTYRIITLEQRIKGLRDFQNVKICDDKGTYFLFDDYQLTLFDHENLVARQWYQLPLHSDDKVKEKRDEIVTCEPVLANGKIIWIEVGGQAHAVTIE
ncbi:MAG: hypothetical protein H7X94_02465 [Vallitaleaceae bacterium]|nr:hypothetical protein [Vallitaleaceae bacterium]